MTARKLLGRVLVLGALCYPAIGQAADMTCDSLVPSGHRMICSGFEPNWAVELVCAGGTMTSNFIDAFSGDGITTTPGSAAVSSINPWGFSTSTGVSGSIAYTPGGCLDEADMTHDFTFTPTSAPGLGGPFFPFCCRID